jgi:preprotein translocase subunit SecA
VIYGERRRVLEGEDIADQVRSFISDTVAGYVRSATADGYPEDWDLEQLWTALGQLYPVSLTIEDVERESGAGRDGLSSEFLVEIMVADAEAAYNRREAELGEEVTRELERRVILSVLDRKWREHLYEMDYLRDGIGLRAMAQRDPLVEYQREGYDLFVAMMDAIKEETVGYLFHVEVQVNAEEAPVSDAAGEESLESTPAVVEEHHPQIAAKGLGPSRPQQLEYSAPTEDGGVERGYIDDSGEEPIEVDENASRAERRRAERANRKRRG